MSECQDCQKHEIEIANLNSKIQWLENELHDTEFNRTAPEQPHKFNPDCDCDKCIGVPLEQPDMRVYQPKKQGKFDEQPCEKHLDSEQVNGKCLACENAFAQTDGFEEWRDKWFKSFRAGGFE